jgi:hypothetical protein
VSSSANPPPSDTAPEAEAIRFALYSQMSPARKTRVLVELTRSANTLALAGLRQRFPGADQAELLLRLAALRLGDEVVARVYGWRAPGHGT